jgi:hypothetical protein
LLNRVPTGGCFLTTNLLFPLGTTDALKILGFSISKELERLLDHFAQRGLIPSAIVANQIGPILKS